MKNLKDIKVGDFVIVYDSSMTHYSVKRVVEVTERLIRTDKNQVGFLRSNGKCYHSILDYWAMPYNRSNYYKYFVKPQLESRKEDLIQQITDQLKTKDVSVLEEILKNVK